MATAHLTNAVHKLTPQREMALMLRNPEKDSFKLGETVHNLSLTRAGLGMYKSSAKEA